MVFAYFLLGQDNNSFFLDSKNLLAPTCSKCGYLYDLINYFNPSFKLKRRTNDISYTYDGRCIVSLRFKEFCKREGYVGLTFKVFEREPNFYLFQVDNELSFDSAVSKTEFLEYCEECNNYKEIIGFSPGHLRSIGNRLSDGFYRTDLLFGSGNSKHPLIIVAPETKIKFEREKLQGGYLEPIEMSSNS